MDDYAHLKGLVVKLELFVSVLARCLFFEFYNVVESFADILTSGRRRAV